MAKKATTKKVATKKAVAKVSPKKEVKDTRVQVYMPVDMEVSPLRVDVNSSVSEYERGESYKVEPGIAKILSARLGVDVTKK